MGASAGVVWDNPVEESDRRDRDVKENFSTFPPAPGSPCDTDNAPCLPYFSSTFNQ